MKQGKIGKQEQQNPEKSGKESIVKPVVAATPVFTKALAREILLLN